MESLEEQLLSIKNPFNAFNFSQKYNVWRAQICDKNSFVWKNFIEKFYNTLLKYKVSDISYMDYYVLLYLLENLNLVFDKSIIHYSQLGLCSLPKIYNGDHLRVIQFINTLGFRIGIANLLLYRCESGKERGKLMCIYSEKEHHKISYHTRIQNIKNINNTYCNPSDGFLFLLPNDT